MQPHRSKPDAREARIHGPFRVFGRQANTRACTNRFARPICVVKADGMSTLSGGVGGRHDIC